MNIVVLEQESMGYDIDITCFEEFGEVTYYRNTTNAEVQERIKDAEYSTRFCLRRYGGGISLVATHTCY